MLKTIVASYKTYYRNFPVILLFALPLLVLSVLEIYFRGINSESKGVAYFIALAGFFMPLISAATDVAVYKKLLKSDCVNPFICLKTLFIYMFTQIALGLVGVTVPVLLLSFLLGIWMGAETALATALVINIFLGMYVLVRFNVILPLIVQHKKLSWKKLTAYTNRGYKEWLAVAVLVYAPYLAINYIFSCPMGNAVLTNLFMFMFACFNVNYVMQNKYKEPVSETVKPEKIEPVVTVSVQKAEVKAKTAVKKPVKKVAVKTPKSEKTAAVKEKKPVAAKTVKKTAVKKSSAAVKKAAAPKKPEL